MIAGIAEGLSSFKSEMDTQLSLISDETLHQKHLVRSISDRVTCLEAKYELHDVPKKHTKTNCKEEQLGCELEILEHQLRVLAADNDELKNRNRITSNTRSHSNPKINPDDNQSHSVRSFSPISSPSHRDVSNYDLMNQIHSLRLDSDGSQTQQIALELLKDKAIQANQQLEARSIKTSRNIRLDSQVGQPIWKVVNPLSFLSKNMSSMLNDSQESADHTSKHPRDETLPRNSHQAADNSRVEKRMHAKSRVEDDPSLRKEMTIKNVRNFDDFRNTLFNLKLTLDNNSGEELATLTRSNLTQFKDLLSQYSHLDDQMLQFYKQKSITISSDFDDIQFFDQQTNDKNHLDLSRRHSTPSTIGYSEVILLRKLQSIIRQSRLAEYQTLLQEEPRHGCRANELLHRIEQDLMYRESEFQAIEKQLRVKI
jgi:hypothetical protein